MPQKMSTLLKRRLLIAAMTVALAAAAGWGVWANISSMTAPSWLSPQSLGVPEVPGPSAAEEGTPQVTSVVAGGFLGATQAGRPQAEQAAPGGSSPLRPTARRLQPPVAELPARQVGPSRRMRRSPGKSPEVRESPSDASLPLALATKPRPQSGPAQSRAPAGQAGGA